MLDLRMDPGDDSLDKLTPSSLRGLHRSGSPVIVVVKAENGLAGEWNRDCPDQDRKASLVPNLASRWICSYVE